MQVIRFLVLLILAATLNSVSGQAAVAEDNIRLYSFDDLKAKQMKTYNTRLDEYAMVETWARLCRKSSGFEKRVVAGVSKCVTKGTVKRAVSDFRARMAYHLDDFEKERTVSVERFCSLADDVIDRGVETLKRAATKMANMCESYLRGNSFNENF